MYVRNHQLLCAVREKKMSVKIRYGSPTRTRSSGGRNRMEGSNAIHMCQFEFVSSPVMYVYHRWRCHAFADDQYAVAKEMRNSAMHTHFHTTAHSYSSSALLVPFSPIHLRPKITMLLHAHIMYKHRFILCVM